MIVDCAHYRGGERQREKPLTLAEAEERLGQGYVWVGLADPSREELAEAQARFCLHPLAVEDAAKGHQRPKLEEYEDDQFFIVLRTARYDDAQEVVEFGEVHAFLGRSYVVVVRHGHANELRGVRERLEARPHLVDRGPGAVVWAILDKIVDDYAPVIDGLENDIEEVERAIFEGGPDQSQRIYLLRRELAGFYRAVHPLLAPLEAVERGAYPAIDAELRAYFRDVADHTRIVNDEVLMQRDLLDGVLSANLATIGVRQNDVVRKVSGWAAIVTVPTLIASVYGMNFEHMPELGWAFGYPLALALMVVCALGLWRFLRRVGWL